MESLPRAYFEDVYRANRDPWRFETSPYESAKYAATVAALPRERYRAGFEIGCAIGVLTERLAPKCEQLLAVDTVASVLDRAKWRCRRFPQARFRQMHVPEEFPDQSFDLIVMSEVGYYLSAPALEVAREKLCAALEVGGHLLLVHWTPFVHDYPLTGDQVHEAFLARAGSGGPLRHVSESRAEMHRRDLFERI
jgi:Nodulation protein S (NodS)